MRKSHLGRIYVVDDDPQMLQTLALCLHLFGYEVRTFSDSNQLLSLFYEYVPDLVICDVMMPAMSGIELLEAINRFSPETPVILLTGCVDVEYLSAAVRLGAVDFLLKPCSGETIINAVKKGLERTVSLRKKREEESRVEWLLEASRGCVNNGDIMKEMTREVISILMVATELRDDDTGTHIFRIGRYAGRLARELALSDEYRDMITMASLMHDIGKVGVPDAILLKPGPLTCGEFEIIKRHTLDGARILGSSSNPVMKMAASIALTHHERWDGSGYPAGLKGNAIPLEGRIVMLVDQYDALRSKRAYKNGKSHEEVCHILTNGDGITRREHFDPAVLAAFASCAADFDAIFRGNNGDDLFSASEQCGAVSLPDVCNATYSWLMKESRGPVR